MNKQEIEKQIKNLEQTLKRIKDFKLFSQIKQDIRDLQKLLKDY